MVINKALEIKWFKKINVGGYFRSVKKSIEKIEK